MYTLDASGKCLSWHYFPDKWTSEKATCGFRQDGGKTVFFVKTLLGMKTAQVDGNTIWSADLRSNAARRAASYAAAKASLDSYRKHGVW